MSIQTPSSEDQLFREMMEAGERLRAAMAAEEKLSSSEPRGDLRGFRKQWAECRRAVDQRAEDYSHAVRRWRIAATENAGVAPAPQEGVLAGVPISLEP